MAGHAAARFQGFWRSSLTVMAAVAFLAGCGKAKEPLLPVAGRILVKKQPLANGTVVFHPDAAKGNHDKREPRAAVADDHSGGYRLKTGDEDGAPAGWYRVTVNALKPVTSSVRRPEWLADPKYADEKTSGLAVEVVKDAPPQTYDFELDPPP
jgi:hypothetical protein